LGELGTLMQPALIDAYEAAQMLFGSRDHKDYKKVLRLIHAGAIRHVPVGKRYWVVRRAVEELRA
jgi:hypothetical protein